MICELSLFDLKTNRSTWLEPTEASPCHALLAGALELAAILCHVTPFRMAPAGPPRKSRQQTGFSFCQLQTGGFLLVPARGVTSPPTVCQGSCPRVSAVSRRPGWKRIFIENAKWILATLPRDPQGALWGYFQTSPASVKGAEHCGQAGIWDAWAAGLTCSPVEPVTCPVNHSRAFTGQFRDHWDQLTQSWEGMLWSSSLSWISRLNRGEPGPWEILLRCK